MVPKKNSGGPKQEEKNQGRPRAPPDASPGGGGRKASGSRSGRNNNRGRRPRRQAPGRGGGSGGSRGRSHRGTNPRRRGARGQAAPLARDEFTVFVRNPQPFADYKIKSLYVDPVVEAVMKRDIGTITYKAKGLAINAAVRAATLLEDRLGVMKKAIEISSNLSEEDPTRRGSKNEAVGRSKKKSDRTGTGQDEGNGVDKRGNRVLSSIEITMTRFT